MYITFGKSLRQYKEETLAAVLKKLKDYDEAALQVILREFAVSEDFLAAFRNLDMILKRQASKETKILYEIQTGGEGLTREMARFFRKWNITICLLLDGPSNIHKKNNALLRRNIPHGAAVQAAALLKEQETPFYIGVAVTNITAAHMEGIFKYFAEHKWQAQAYWPAICELGNSAWEHILTKEVYGTFLKRLFWFWKEARMSGGALRIREFENLIKVLNGQEPLLSSLSGYCPFQNVILPDGKIYRRGCKREPDKEGFAKQDFYMWRRREAQPQCRICRWVSVCQSDHACCQNTSGFCAVYREFYSYVLPGLFEFMRVMGRQVGR